MSLIDREVLYKKVSLIEESHREKLIAMDIENPAFHHFTALMNEVSFIKYMIADAPTVDAEPVQHGHNENQDYHEVDEFRCSECGLHLEDWTRYVHDEDCDDVYAKDYAFKYCPDCGAKMED